MKLISQGAEAVLYETEDKIIKKRISKGYRHPVIDNELRKSRTNREARILKKVDFPVPAVFNVDKKEMSIEMEKIEGLKLSEHLEEIDYKKVCHRIGEQVEKMHSANIIHGDLTTSNMIYSKNKIYFIDFGLSFTSTKNEDKAVDLHLLRQALESRHNKIYEESFKAVKKGYADEDVLKRLEEVELRGRNKNK
ncbi:MAG: KEOPS complex kinase/ATPase Bud32 [Nanoarchaeota archaeon]